MTKTAPHVTCIGLANVDVIASVPQEFLHTHDIALGASTILDSCQTGNMVARLDRPEFFPGGCAANTACGLSLFGVNARFIGKTGDDIYADIFRRGFDAYKVLFDTPPQTMKMTSTCLTLVTPDKNRSFVICTDTAGWFLSESDLPELPGDGQHSVYIETNTARIPPHATATTLLQAAVSKYENAGVPVFINLNDWQIVSRSRDMLLGILDRNRVAFYIGNIHELHTLFGVTDNHEALTAATESGRNFAVTDGQNGAYVIEGGKIGHLPAAALHSSRIVNTLGAGDQFAAGFVAGLMTGMTAMDSCLNGIRAATEILMKRDARPDVRSYRKWLGTDRKTAAGAAE